MAVIKVNSTTMREKAASFNTVANSIKTYTDEMLNEVDGLKTTWEGEAAEELIQKFKNLASTFEGVYDTILAYSTFLEKAAEAYDATENANKINK